MLYGDEVININAEVFEKSAEGQVEVLRDVFLSEHHFHVFRTLDAFSSFRRLTALVKQDQIPARVDQHSLSWKQKVVQKENSNPARNRENRIHDLNDSSLQQ